MALLTLLSVSAGACVGSATEDELPRDRRVVGVKPCEVSADILERVWRGYKEGRSGDVLVVEWAPNQFAGRRHSTPFPYTQDVPLVLYGPGFIRAGTSSPEEVTVADLAPTFAELLRFDDFPARDGQVLKDALLPRGECNGIPRLIFTLVWDGGGDNVLNQWPDSWPHLKDLMARGTSYENATVGSSPSITPAIHATLGTGTFPQSHGHTDMDLRVDGKIVFSWQGIDPQYLDTKTLADLWDPATGNAALVGTMARDSYHLGMIGHGASLPEGDNDVAVIDDIEGTDFRTNEEFYSLPDYLRNRKGLLQAVEEVDRRDGSADGRWLGNEIVADDPLIRYTPAWSIYQTKRLTELLTKEGFGADDVPDLFFTNYKSTDLAGHRWNMLEPEEREVLEEQDRQLQELIALLDRSVGEDGYVLALTADHGMTPYPESTGGWKIESEEVTADVEKRFDKVTPDVPLIAANRGYQMFLDPRELERNDVSPEQVAEFLRDYLIEDNVTVTNPLDGDFRESGRERVFLTALTPEELRSALGCARGLERDR